MRIDWNDEHLEQQILSLLREINASTRTIQSTQEELKAKMSEITDILDALESDEAAQIAVVGKVVTTLQGLTTQIATLEAQIAANPNDPTIVTRLQAIRTGLEGDTTTLSNALPAAPSQPAPAPAP